MWKKLKKFFLYSETIFLARVQVFLGTTLGVIAVTDPHLIAPLVGKWFPIFLIGHGILAEYLRKRRDEDLKKRGQ